MITLFNDIPFLWLFLFFLALYLLKSIVDYLFGRFIQPHIDRKIARDRAELRVIELEFFRHMSRRAGPDPRDMFDAVGYGVSVLSMIDPIAFKKWRNENKKPMTADQFNEATVKAMSRRAGPPQMPWPRPRCIQVPLAEVPITETDVHEFGSDHRIPPRCIIFHNRQNNDKND